MSFRDRIVHVEICLVREWLLGCETLWSKAKFVGEVGTARLRVREVVWNVVSSSGSHRSGNLGYGEVDFGQGLEVRFIRTERSVIQHMGREDGSTYTDCGRTTPDSASSVQTSDWRTKVIVVVVTCIRSSPSE